MPKYDNVIVIYDLEVNFKNSIYGKNISGHVDFWNKFTSIDEIQVIGLLPDENLILCAGKNRYDEEIDICVDNPDAKILFELWNKNIELDDGIIFYIKNNKILQTCFNNLNDSYKNWLASIILGNEKN